ncbi:MAG: trans-sulfuration enzyme family protein [Acidobacteriota bacterium]
MSATPPLHPSLPLPGTAALDGVSTTAVHGGSGRPPVHDAIPPPVVLSSTYRFRNTAELLAFRRDHLRREEYGRYGNPTVRETEGKLAALEAGTTSTHDLDALVFASGMTAITTLLLALLRSGSHLILTDDGYRRTRQFVSTFLGRLGIAHTIVPATDQAALESAIRPETRVLVTELPTNPFLRVPDLRPLVDLTHRHRIRTIIDATFATPYNLRPLEHGADFVVHSATKYLGGHHDLLAGVVVGRPDAIAALRELQGVLGGISDPHAAYLLHRGLRTFALRMERHNTNGLAVATFLETHPRVRRVFYPGLPSHPDHAVATALMRGHGGVVSFEIDGDGEETARFVDGLHLAAIAPSLGGVDTLVEQPALMSYHELTADQRRHLGITDNLVRLACGIEDTDDLVNDLRLGLAQIHG